MEISKSSSFLKNSSDWSPNVDFILFLNSGVLKSSSVKSSGVFAKFFR